MSLTTTAYYARNIIRYGGVGLVGFIILWTGGVAAIAAYKAAHPPYIPPENRFGKLPAIVYPEKSYEKKNFNFELPNDDFPKYKDQAKVYVVYRPVSTFLALEEETKRAKNLGFVNTPVEIKPNIYEFKNDSLNQTLTVNVLNGSYKMEYPYLNDQLLLNPEKVPSKEEAIQHALTYLQTGGQIDTDLTEGNKKVSFWKINYDGLKSVPSQSEANAVRVDFFRKNLEDDYQIKTAEPSKASVSVLVSGSGTENKRIIEVNYNYINIDRESYSTYLIKSAEQAADELKAGKYWPAVDTSTSSVSIKNVYLAYFEPISLTNYMLPVYVFEGDNNFVAYVTAVTDEWISK